MSAAVTGAVQRPTRGADTPPTATDAVSWAPRLTYLALLTWAFTLFNSVRVLAYLPTLWAIQVSGDSSQHSLWTWITWLGANATMAAWLYEQNGRQIHRAMLVNACNALMCLITVIVIVSHRV